MMKTLSTVSAAVSLLLLLPFFLILPHRTHLPLFLAPLLHLLTSQPRGSMMSLLLLLLLLHHQVSLTPVHLIGMLLALLNLSICILLLARTFKGRSPQIPNLDHPHITAFVDLVDDDDLSEWQRAGCGKHRCHHMDNAERIRWGFSALADTMMQTAFFGCGHWNVDLHLCVSAPKFTAPASLAVQSCLPCVAISCHSHVSMQAGSGSDRSFASV